ncbi:MAG: 50S ribosomal protein L18 [Nitrososphaeria archaeon]
MTFKRRLQFKTDYKKRKKALVSRLPLVYMFKSNKNIWAHVIRPTKKGDITVVQANSKELEKLGWKFSRKNYPAAYLVGLLLGKRAVANGIEEAIYYSGVRNFIAKSKATAFLKGVTDAGLKVRVDEEIFPDEGVIKGEQIVGYAKKLLESGYSGPQFARVMKEIENLSEVFESIKKKIMEEEIK